MKILIIAVLLSIMQAVPPVPRQAPDNSAGAGGNTNNHGKGKYRQASKSLTASDSDKTPPDQGNGNEQGGNDTEHSIIISKIPSVTVDSPKRDWADWGTWLFNLLLVSVGGLQVWLLYRTYTIMGDQADSMRKQLAEMRATGRQTESLIKQASIQAEASRDSVRLTEETVRGRIVVVNRKLEWSSGAPIKLSIDFKNIGASVADERHEGMAKRWSVMPDGTMPISLPPESYLINPGETFTLVITDTAPVTEEFFSGIPEVKETYSGFTDKLTTYLFFRLEYRTLGKTYTIEECVYIVKVPKEGLLGSATVFEIKMRECGKWNTAKQSEYQNVSE